MLKSCVLKNDVFVYLGHMELFIGTQLDFCRSQFSRVVWSSPQNDEPQINQGAPLYRRTPPCCLPHGELIIMYVGGRNHRVRSGGDRLSPDPCLFINLPGIN